MFLKRALITFTLGPLAFALIYLGGWPYFIGVAVILALATIEYTHLMRHLTWTAPSWLLLPLVLAFWIDAHWFEAAWSALLLVIGLVLIMFQALWRYERRASETPVGDWLALMTGLLVMGWMASFFFRIRHVLPGDPGWQWTMVVMGGTWMADSGAYAFGKSMGRHKLAPRLSPNKTIEGYVGGILVGTLLAIGLATLFDLSLPLALVMGLIVSVISPAGDLLISLIKREAGVKDSGTFLPGHGGALDRTDSMIWSVMICYSLLSYVLVG